MRILAYMGERWKREKRRDPAKARERSGVFTSGIVAVEGGRKIALFFTGRKHAGEGLAQVLSKRREELEAPIEMCDALRRNVSGEFKSVVANSLAHARRRFVAVAASFPEE